MLNDPVVIVGAARTPMGGFQGDFASLAASDLGAVAIRAAIERAGIAPEDVQEVIMGNVLPAGQGQAPARQASLKAGVPLAAGCTTVNKMCGSAMKAAMLAHDLIVAGSGEIVVAGGMESMTQRAVPDAEGARRLPDGPPDRLRPHVSRRPRGRLRQGPADGHVRRGLRGDVRLHARSAGRLRAGVALARARRQQRRHVRLGDRAGDGRRQEGRRRHRQGRAAGEGHAGQDPAAEARVSQGRHGDGGELELDLRRRRGAGADAPLDRRAPRARAARGDRRRTRRTRRSRGCSRRRRSARSRSSTGRPAGRRRTSTCSRSTKRSRW